MNRLNSYGIYVGNIDPTMTVANLRTLFATAGQIVHVNLLGPEGGTHRYGFVEYDSEVGRSRAIEMFNNYRFGTKNLKVSETKGRSNRNAMDNRGPGQTSTDQPIDKNDPNSRNQFQDGHMVNRTDLQTQLLREFTMQQYAAALQLEHAKLILKAKELGEPKSSRRRKR
ncbi:RNA-binding protein [Perkinsela sp. CCAP 1560/4]|nr:RNA-binding protein [Perkinsela sp. CCAP 1560/4]|eukprot:KNH08883.1 RNA-binding protein [Perkinsela sp. CCAP 1560/4]